MKCTYYKVMQYRLMDGKRMYARCAGTVDGPLRNARKAISALLKEASRTDQYEYELVKVTEEVVK